MSEKIKQQWDSLHKGAGEAIQWVEEVKKSSKRVATEAGGLIRELHRARNQAKSLARVSLTPMSIGFFGLSQAGKSYLISALAADENGQLETDFGGVRLNFIDHVNPVGGGKEATGLITRFSGANKQAPDGACPIELRLFKEIEIAKILSNSWFEDFDHQRINSAIDENKVRALVESMTAAAGTSDVAGVSADDVVALWDYLEFNYRNSVMALEGVYWQQVLKIAPKLSIQNRAKLFSILWGELPELTALYEQLANTLQRMGGAETVYAPLEALVVARNEGYERNNSIMNVDALNALRLNIPGYRIAADAASTALQVRPFNDGQLGPAVPIDSAELAALTTEFVFNLANEPVNSVVKTVDLLDFPGYRSRQKLLDIKHSDHEPSPVPSLFLRGKVAYLFERYTNEQEMNSLVLCTSTFKQSEVVNVGKVLTEWVHKTQGLTAEDRSQRPAGLIWTLTMADGFVGNTLNNNESAFEEACSNMMKLTIKERFGNLEWMGNWAGKSFNNTCLVRKPRLKTNFIRLENNREIEISPSGSELLNKLGHVFVSNELVCQHIDNPVDVWNAMLELDDGGIAHFSKRIELVASIDYKLSRIEQQFNERMEQLISRLDKFFQKDGEKELAIRKENANKILNAFVRNENARRQIGDFISYLSLSDEALRSLYLNADLLQQSLEDSAKKAEEEDDFDFFGEDSGGETVVESKPYVELKTQEHLFAEAAYKMWVSHLRELDERQGLLQQFGLTREVVKKVAEEIIVCASRVGLEEQLVSSLMARAQNGIHKDRLVQRHVLTVQLIFNDFCAWFGYLIQDVAERPRVLKLSKDMSENPAALFETRSSFDEEGLPLLEEKVSDNARVYSDFWISGLAHQTIANAGHKGGSEITPDQNSQLGKIISTICGGN